MAQHRVGHIRIRDDAEGLVEEMRAAVDTVGVLGIIGKARDEYDIRRRKCEERPRKAPRIG